MTMDQRINLAMEVLKTGANNPDASVAVRAASALLAAVIGKPELDK